MLNSVRAFTLWTLSDLKEGVLPPVEEPAPPPTPTPQPSPPSPPAPEVPPEQAANITVNTFPDGAQVYLDGQFLGLTNATFTVASGIHTLEVRKSGYTTTGESFSINPGETLTFTYTLTEEVTPPTQEVGHFKPVEPDGWIIQYGSDEDKPLALKLEQWLSPGAQEGFFSTTKTDPWNIAGILNVITIGGSQANPAVAAMISDGVLKALTSADAGKFFIDVVNYHGDVVYALRGWNKEDTEAAVNYVLQNNLPTISVSGNSADYITTTQPTTEPEPEPIPSNIIPETGAKLHLNKLEVSPGEKVIALWAGKRCGETPDYTFSTQPATVRIFDQNNNLVSEPAGSEVRTYSENLCEIKEFRAEFNAPSQPGVYTLRGCVWYHPVGPGEDVRGCSDAVQLTVS